MSPLRNPRHEKFVQSLLEGKSAPRAYVEAGYAKDDGNATRLRVNPKVQDRLAELQAEVAKQTKVTVESLLDELENARQRADFLDQLSAAVRAIESKARISGCWCRRWKSAVPVNSLNVGQSRKSPTKCCRISPSTGLSLSASERTLSTY